MAGILASGAQAAQKVLVLKSGNHTAANRPIRSIDRIVIHVTEGSFWGSVRWLRNSHSGGSSHYVVSRRGQVLQMVSTSDIAWHSGNSRVNARSIGIEHEGYTYRRGSITAKEYEASARLVAYLAKRMGIPIDRRHIIGHHEVQDPYNPRAWGGFAHHTDPGPHWNWKRYLALVRRFAKNPRRPRYVRLFQAPRVRVVRAKRQVPVERHVHCGFRPSIHSTTLYERQTLAGQVPWRVQPCGRRIHRVDFFVDGKLVWLDRTRPFVFARGRGWNSTTVANGWHTLALRAHGPRGHRVRNRIRVKIENRLYAVNATGVAPHQSVAGVVLFRARATAPTRRVRLFVDGKAAAQKRRQPYRFAWDSAKVANGEHRLELVAEARDGRRTTTRVDVLVANAEPAAAAAPRVVWQSLAHWQVVDGFVDWRALVEGDVAQVEFWIDGKLRTVDREAPYGLDGLWDTTAAKRGPHHVKLRVVAPTGVAVERRALVLVGRASDPVRLPPLEEGT